MAWPRRLFLGLATIAPLYFDLQVRAEERQAKPRRSWRPWRPRQFGRRVSDPAPQPATSG